jgi:hypothetical protein
MCGEEALEYVRYRHTDNDFVRAARQQDFLREARQKVGPTRLIRDRDELIKIFTRYTTSDIEDPQTMLEVLKLFLAAHDNTVKEIHFKGHAGPSYVTASEGQIQRAVDQFLGIEDTAGPRAGGEQATGGGEAPEQEKVPDGGGGGSGGPEGPDLIDATGAGQPYAQQFDEKLEFPVYYPTRLTTGSSFGDDSRAYSILGPEAEERFPAYKLVVVRDTLGFDEYYGVMGTEWLDPPILENPSATLEIEGRTYQLFYDGDRLRLVAWQTGQGSYWVSNTLLQTLEEEEMLGIARSLRAFSPEK